MSDYFRKYLKVAPLSHALWRANEAYELEKISLKPPVLDIGCGFGEFTGVFFESQLKIGVDISPKKTLEAIKTGKYKKTLQADARNLPFENNSFNTVISISALEHIKDVEKVFQEVHRVLKKNGLFVFTVLTQETKNYLLIPKFFKKIGLNLLGNLYFNLFNLAFKHDTMIPAQKWQQITQNAGFKVSLFKGTISPKTIKVYELFLPFALPTQFFKALFGKRLPISPQWRVNLLHQLFKTSVGQGNKSTANVLIVARKPK